MASSSRNTTTTTSNSITNTRTTIKKAEEIFKNNWRKAEEIFKEDRDALTAKLNSNGDSALHIAMDKAENIQFVENLLKEITPESLPEMVNNKRVNPLHRAAKIDNTMVAKMLAKKNPDLLFILDVTSLPIHKAIINSHKTTFLYLLDACKQYIEISQKDGYHSPFEGVHGARLLTNAIDSGFLDVSHELITEYPHMARTKSKDTFPLTSIGKKWDLYYSGTRYNFYQRLVYSYLPREENCLHDKSMIQDIENQETCSTNPKNTKSRFYSVIMRIYVKMWKAAILRVPHIKHLLEEKAKHNEALVVLKRICQEVCTITTESEICKQYCDAMKFAVNNDTPEVIEEIIKSFPYAIWTKIDGYSLIQVAIRNRSEKVYNFLLCHLSYDKYAHQQRRDKDDNNLLHLAAKLAPVHKLNLVSGAALQMQRELQWFEEVGNFVKPKYKDQKTKKEETPIMVFREEHKELRKEGEEWMKKTADSYTIVAALIITIVFAAEITVPGGNDGDTGKAIYEIKLSFVVFAVSDAISLFASTTSLLLFLSILTTRYREEDFLYKLPTRLILGLGMLFLSVTSMMVAFSATLYLMFGQEKAWLMIPIATLTCLPIASFVTLQLPLLVGVISSTYGQGIFVTQSDRRMKKS
ncbi:unnamed protein product [Lactuca saligna]|uniref:PGG domain-containing protein n=1 Tax=Lactuca saligna TaxID=75948 RepID=A0AA35YNX6_LACSI|nr:unnamed protein product [Lactuca saligna]